jgi:hypothetical protein
MSRWFEDYSVSAENNVDSLELDVNAPRAFDPNDVLTWSLRCALSDRSQHELLVPAMSRIELEMLLISGAVRSKTDWFRKFQDKAVRDKWRAELVDEDRGYSRAMVNFVFAELEVYYLPQVDLVTGITPDSVDGVFRTAALLTAAESADFKAAMLALESTTRKDWHPGSNEMVLDVVHPSLFCAAPSTSTCTTEDERLRRNFHFLTPFYQVGASPPSNIGAAAANDDDDDDDDDDAGASQASKRARISEAAQVVAPEASKGAMQAPPWALECCSHALANLKLCDFEAADFNRVLQSGMIEHSDSFFQSLLSLASRQDAVRAMELFEQILSIEPKDHLGHDTRVLLARLLVKAGEKQKALSLLENGIDFRSLDQFPELADQLRVARFVGAEAEYGPLVSDDSLHWRRTVGASVARFVAEEDAAAHHWGVSKLFQWLPSEVDVDAHGGARFVSYINNLHPGQHGALYKKLDLCLSRFVPLFERVLGDLAGDEHRRIPYEGLGPLHRGAANRGRVAERGTDKNGEITGAIANGDDDLLKVAQPDDDVFCVPEVSAATKMTLPRVVSLKNRRLQVITKIAAIHLTPEKPEYQGGTWHLEGCTNEAIVATGIYYYDSDNISDTKLGFRAAVQEPSCSHSEIYVHEKHYGVGNCMDLVQPRGSVDCIAGRAIAFGNILQHRVHPFSLVDRTRAGHRRIIVFFLVDPTKRIVSTIDVPPQQRSWIISVWQRTPPLNLLPLLCLELIADFAGAGITFDEAAATRSALMQDRARTFKLTNDLFERNINLCEH